MGLQFDIVVGQEDHGHLIRIRISGKKVDKVLLDYDKYLNDLIKRQSLDGGF
jgi:hypothetical protein